MFELEHEVDGKVQVPVLFSVNGIRIGLEDDLPHVHIECRQKKPLYLIVCFSLFSFGCLFKCLYEPKANAGVPIYWADFFWPI